MTKACVHVYTHKCKSEWNMHKKAILHISHNNNIHNTACIDTRTLEGKWKRSRRRLVLIVLWWHLSTFQVRWRWLWEDLRVGRRSWGRRLSLHRLGHVGRDGWHGQRGCCEEGERRTGSSDSGRERMEWRTEYNLAKINCTYIPYSIYAQVL